MTWLTGESVRGVRVNIFLLSFLSLRADTLNLDTWAGCTAGYLFSVFRKEQFIKESAIRIKSKVFTWHRAARLSRRCEFAPVPSHGSIFVENINVATRIRGRKCYITKLQKCSITVVKSYQGRKCYITAVKWYQCRECLITVVKWYQGSKMFHRGSTKISRSKMKHHMAVKWYQGRKCDITEVKSY